MRHLRFILWGILAIGMLGLVSPVTAQVQGFAANNLLFATAEDELVEFNPRTGATVSILKFQGVNELSQPCFTPAGTVVVAFDFGVVELTPDGTIMRIFQTQAAVTGLTAGPGGALVVITTDSLLVLEPTPQGFAVIHEILEATGWTKPRFLRNGHLHVLAIDLTTDPPSSQLLETEISTGTIIRKIVIQGQLRGFVPDLQEGIWITVDQSVNRIDLEGNVLDVLALAGYEQPCFLPNGLLGLVGDDGMIEVDTVTGQTIREHIVPRAQSVAVVPFRFNATIWGLLTGPEQQLSLQNEAAILMLSPWSQRVVLALSGGGISTLFDSQMAVMHGYEVQVNSAAHVRFIQAAPVPPTAGSIVEWSEPYWNVGLRALGRQDSIGYYTIRNARGDAKIASSDGVFNGTVSSRALLNAP